jgi:DNA-binding beta-propeller fold protein YncE
MARVCPKVSFSKSRADYYTAYYGFQSMPVPKDVQPHPKEMAVVASHQPKSTLALIDGKNGARWRS